MRTKELEKAEGVSGLWAREWVTLKAAAGLFFTQFICSLNMSKCWGVLETALVRGTCLHEARVCGLYSGRGGG